LPICDLRPLPKDLFGAIRHLRGARALLAGTGKRRGSGEGAVWTEEPIMNISLSFLDRDIERSPERLKPLSATCIEEARSLTKDVEVSDDESLPDDVTL